MLDLLFWQYVLQPNAARIVQYCMQKKKHRSRVRSKAKLKEPIPVHLLKGEPNPFESDVDPARVKELTDRVFRSALGKFGWDQDEHGHIEHVGNEHQSESRA